MKDLRFLLRIHRSKPHESYSRPISSRKFVLSTIDRIHGLDPWIRSMDPMHGSDPWNRSMDPIHGSDPWIRSMDPIHGSDPWIRSMDLIPRIPKRLPKTVPRRLQGYPRESKKGPKETQASPKGSQETPRHFATKTSKLVEAFTKNWSDRPQDSNASTIFLKMLKNSWFFSTFCVAAEARAGRDRLPALNSARTPKCKHCLGKNHNWKTG